jgi:hypothetical protein
MENHEKVKILCPDCNNTLKINEEVICNNCHKIFSHKKNIIKLFGSNKNPNKYSEEDEFLLDKINKLGYEDAIKIFIKKFPQHKTQLINPEFNQSADHIFYCLNEKNKRCLILENKFGNTVETISHIFDQVISQNSKIEHLEIQSKRFKNKKNITLVNSGFKKLNFSDNYFDLILIENIEKMNDDEQIFLLFKEIFRILTPEGCLVFNNTKSHDQMNQILKKSNFKIKQYWSMQKNQYPSFSGKIDDHIALRWYMNNVSNFLTSQKISLQKKIMLWTMKNNLKQTTTIFKKKFVPTRIFCCYKNNFSTSLLDLIEKETNYNNFVIQSRPKKIKIIVLDNKGIPRKIVNFNRFGYKFPSKITTAYRKFPKMNDPKERIWIENWYEGESINPEKIEHVEAAIEWLIKFQKDTKQNSMDINKLHKEIDEIKINVEKSQSLNFPDCFKWIENYKNYIEKNNFHYTAIHGDYWIDNILINEKLTKISVIDWEKYEKKWTPFYDFMFFFIRLMTKTKTSSLDTEKFENFLDIKSEKSKMISSLKKKIDLHFDCNFDFLILLRMFIIKRILEPPYGSSIINKSDSDKQLKMLELLSEKQELFI